jgi:hypothetical protein
MSIQPMGLDQVGSFEPYFVPPLSVSPNLISALRNKNKIDIGWLNLQRSIASVKCLTQSA